MRLKNILTILSLAFLFFVPTALAETPDFNMTDENVVVIEKTVYVISPTIQSTLFVKDRQTHLLIQGALDRPNETYTMEIFNIKSGLGAPVLNPSKHLHQVTTDGNGFFSKDLNVTGLGWDVSISQGVRVELKNGQKIYHQFDNLLFFHLQSLLLEHTYWIDRYKNEINKLGNELAALKNMLT